VDKYSFFVNAFSFVNGCFGFFGVGGVWINGVGGVWIFWGGFGVVGLTKSLFFPIIAPTLALLLKVLATGPRIIFKYGKYSF